MSDYLHGMKNILAIIVPSILALSTVAPIDLIAATGPQRGTEFVYSFNTPGILEEAPSASESSSPYWWIAGGGTMVIEDYVGKVGGRTLPYNDHWRQAYARSNPLDSNNGYHPQNIFRLVGRNTWHNLDQRIQFQIDNINLTNTPNRDGYSGIFFMSRYQDQYNLYYAGIRMDGDAVIKKKYNGTYHTLAQGRVFAPNETFNKYANPNLLPMHQWVGLRNITKTNADGSVTIELYVDRNNANRWEKVLTARDNNFGGVPPITSPGRSGIRSDYMNLKLEDYRAEEI